MWSCCVFVPFPGSSVRSTRWILSPSKKIRTKRWSNVLTLDLAVENVAGLEDSANMRLFRMGITHSSQKTKVRKQNKTTYLLTQHQVASFYRHRRRSRSLVSSCLQACCWNVSALRKREGLELTLQRERSYKLVCGCVWLCFHQFPVGCCCLFLIPVIEGEWWNPPWPGLQSIIGHTGGFLSSVSGSIRCRGACVIQNRDVQMRHMGLGLRGRCCWSFPAATDGV